MAIFMILTVIAAASVFATLFGGNAVEISLGLGAIYFCITFVGYLRHFNQEHADTALD
jgi:hypothetical protein